MQTTRYSSILQAEDCQGESGITAVAGREAIQRVPSNHRQAERKLIALVNDGTFEIDRQGRIWRLRKKFGCRWYGTKIIDVPRQRAEHQIPSGYLQIRAVIDGKRIYGMAHRLVWQYFYGEIPDGMVINHKNGLKNDNCPENLEVVTYSENMKHAYKHGLTNEWGEKNPGAKLTDSEIETIRGLYATGNYLQIDLAKKFSVSFQQISRIVRGERRPKQAGPTDKSDHRFSPSRDPKTGRFVGKKAAGRLLDGREWNQIPNRTNNGE
jgi:hypothetical protein